MIKSYNTTVAASTGSSSTSSEGASSGSSTNTILIIAGVALVAWLGYKFVYKPWKEKKDAEQKKNQ